MKKWLFVDITVISTVHTGLNLVTYFVTWSLAPVEVEDLFNLDSNFDLEIRLFEILFLRFSREN